MFFSKIQAFPEFLKLANNLSLFYNSKFSNPDSMGVNFFFLKLFRTVTKVTQLKVSPIGDVTKSFFSRFENFPLTNADFSKTLDEFSFMVPLLKETSLDNIRTLALKFFKSEGLETREFETWTRNENFRLLGGQISILSSLEESEKSEENISKISQISTFEQLENLEISGKKVWSIEKTEALPSSSVVLIGSSLILNDFIKRLEISNVSKATIEVELSKRGLKKTLLICENFTTTHAGSAIIYPVSSPYEDHSKNFTFQIISTAYGL